MQITALAKHFDLCDEALFNHSHKALFDTPMQDLSLRGRNGQLRDSIRQDAAVWRAGSGFLQPLSGPVLAHADTADTIDLQRPDQALGIVGMNPRCGLRIDCCQLTVQRCRPFSLELGIQLGYLHREGLVTAGHRTEHELGCRLRSFGPSARTKAGASSMSALSIPPKPFGYSSIAR